MRASVALALALVASVHAPHADQRRNEPHIDLGLVHSWAEKIGADLWHFGEYITRRKEVQDSFKTAQIEVRDGVKLVEEMASDIKNMMELKISAVKRITDTAESSAESQQNDPVPSDFDYFNSKRIIPLGEPTPEPEPLEEYEATPPPNKEVNLTNDPHFNDIAVNTSFSSVHVPTNVYDFSPNVIRAIKWSESLDDIFVSNYKADPSLSWQYFGSSTGFMRHYPAMQWKSEPVDLFDCRTRAWYIEAATSPKDIVILVDTSGSMTGQKRDIARHVVSNILDTLGNNDFVNIFYFNETIYDSVTCFADTLVQATLGNVREFKLGNDSITTKGIANFSAALTKAFELLKTYREEKAGAHCNQAIMLITDGVPYNYKEIFEIYNWEDKKNMSARVFTYLIGREVPDVREVQWMACANMGYYVRLSTLAEVQEKVLQYVPVMARPLVLWNDVHPIIWTPVYADITNPKMMDYLWEEKECKDQKELFLSYNADTSLFISKEEQHRRSLIKRKEEQDQHGGLHTYQLMTSVSLPVFDRTENATRVANLLGVAGTDVPIQDIQALMMPHQLGVNAYAFIVTNNGYILIHPDLRPVFQGILKPSYNSVDMAEVELADSEGGPREFAPDVIQLRADIINQLTGKRWVQVKCHYDNMKRVSRLRKQYYYTGISGSPFSLVVVLPEPYGLSRLSIRPEDDIHRNHVKGDDVTNYFKGSRWKVHPDWVYCRHHSQTFESPEEELVFFLEKMVNSRWVWPLKPSPPEFHSNTSSGKPEPKVDYFCDRSLMQAVFFDARVTNWFSQNISSSKDEKGKEFIQRFGITVAFVATHSGLTRWQTFKQNEKLDNYGLEFGDLYPRAIDEVWYRRAVEQHVIDPQSFVYSVPFDAAEEMEEDGSGPLVTATHAIFHTVEKQSAPAAVVGFQFYHSKLHELFTNITFSPMSHCTQDPKWCPKTCKTEELDCYVVDNHGYVVVSESIKEAGRFFGEINPRVMRDLIAEKVFHQVRMFDYQAVCFQPTGTTNPASNLLTPFKYFQQVLSYLMTYFIWIWQNTSIWGTNAYSFSQPNEEVHYQNYDSETESINEGGGISKIPASKAKEREFERLVVINRTRPTPCDQEVFMYLKQQYTGKDPKEDPYKKPSENCTRPFVVKQIPATNLLLIIVDAMCGKDESIPPFQTTSTQVPHNGTLACMRALLLPMERRRLDYCIRHHPNESEINLCGQGSRTSATYLIHILFASLLTILSSYMLLPSKLPSEPL